METAFGKTVVGNDAGLNINSSGDYHNSYFGTLTGSMAKGSRNSFFGSVPEAQIYLGILMHFLVISPGPGT